MFFNVISDASLKWYTSKESAESQNEGKALFEGICRILQAWASLKAAQGVGQEMKPWSVVPIWENSPPILCTLGH